MCSVGRYGLQEMIAVLLEKVDMAATLELINQSPAWYSDTGGWEQYLERNHDEYGNDLKETQLPGVHYMVDDGDLEMAAHRYVGQFLVFGFDMMDGALPEDLVWFANQIIVISKGDNWDLSGSIREAWSEY